MKLDIVDGYWIGTDLARRLGLNSRFFSRFTKCKPKSLNTEIDIQSVGGLVLVRIPIEISNILRDGDHIVSKIEDDDETMFDYIFQLTSDTKIGFWK